MPYMTAKNSAGRTCVYRKGADGKPTGETLGCHDTEAEANAQLRALYANEPAAGKAADALVLYGGAVKALGDGRIGGYLVTFSGAEDPDLSEFRDFFTADTDFDLDDGAGKASVYYAHGQDPHLGKRRLGKATLKADAAGVWAETQLALRDEYERKIYELAKKNALGWSSGSCSHLVERKSIGDAHHVLHWPITEASLTPTPAEPRCGAVALKSLDVPDLLDDGEEKCPACAQKGAERSLAARTDAVSEALEDLLSGWRQVRTAEAKAGRPQLSAARYGRFTEHLRGCLELAGEMAPAADRDRIAQARQLLDPTAARDEPKAPETTEAAGMAADSPPLIPGGDDLYRLLVREETFAAG